MTTGLCLLAAKSASFEFAKSVSTSSSSIDLVVLATVMAATLITSLLFLFSADTCSVTSLGRHIRKSSWAIWMICPLAAQLVIVFLVFHPTTYIIIMVVIVVMELLTIRVNAFAPELSETPFVRYLSWFYFSLGPTCGIYMSAANDGLFRDAKQLAPRAMLYAIPLLAVIFIGLIRVAISGHIEYVPEEVIAPENLAAVQQPEVPVAAEQSATPQVNPAPQATPIQAPQSAQPAGTINPGVEPLMGVEETDEELDADSYDDSVAVGF